MRNISDDEKITLDAKIDGTPTAVAKIKTVDFIVSNTKEGVGTDKAPISAPVTVVFPASTATHSSTPDPVEAADDCYDRESEAAHGVPWQILASIHLNETRMGRLRGTSEAGAKGPMQFMPPTWKAYGSGDVDNDRDAILSAGNYLKQMGWAKNQDKAIWHYNHSDHYVRAIQGYAAVMEAEPRAFYALWGWQVYYRTVAGSIWLRDGYEQTERIAIATYCDEAGEPYCPENHGSRR